VKQKLLEAPAQQMTHSLLLKRMKVDARTFAELITTLEQRGEVETLLMPRAGTHAKHYRLLETGGEL
jgi:hypothetical protein